MLIQPQREIGGEVFPANAHVIRNPGTNIDKDAWEICDQLVTDFAQKGQKFPLGGSLPDAKWAARVTLWFMGFQGSNTTDIRFQVRALYRSAPPPKLSLTDLASALASTTLTSATGGFTQQHAGTWFYLAAGTNMVAGVYKIVSVESSTSVTIDRACTSGGAGSIGVATIGDDGQASVIDTPSGAGLSNLYPHQIVLAKSAYTDGDLVHFTFPLPACHSIRVYIKANGSSEDSDGLVMLTLMPPGGA